jgi:hypothetical protein
MKTICKHCGAELIRTPIVLYDFSQIYSWRHALPRNHIGEPMEGVFVVEEEKPYDEGNLQV